MRFAQKEIFKLKLDNGTRSGASPSSILDNECNYIPQIFIHFCREKKLFSFYRNWSPFFFVNIKLLLIGMQFMLNEVLSSKNKIKKVLESIFLLRFLFKWFTILPDKLFLELMNLILRLQLTFCRLLETGWKKKKREKKNQLRCLLKGKFIYWICFQREDFLVLLCMQSTCKVSCKGIERLVFSSLNLI